MEPNVALQLRSPRDTYVEGEEIDVIVHVTSEEALTCRALTLELGLETHGKGDKDSVSAAKKTIHTGMIPAGTSEFDGSITLPRIRRATPATYHGHFVNVDWFARAVLDMSWVSSADSEVRIQVEPRNKGPEGEGETDSAPSQRIADSKLLEPDMPYAWVLALGLACAGIYYARTDQEGFTVVMLILFILTLAAWYNDRATVRSIGEVSFLVGPRRVFPGSDITACVMLSPPRDLKVNSVSVELRGAEEAISGSGSDKETHTHTLFNGTERLLQDAVVAAGKGLEANVRFRIPDEAPASMELKANRVAWTVELSIESGTEIRTSSLPVIVRPRAPHARS